MRHTLFASKIAQHVCILALFVTRIHARLLTKGYSYFSTMRLLLMIPSSVARSLITVGNLRVCIGKIHGYTKRNSLSPTRVAGRLRYLYQALRRQRREDNGRLEIGYKRGVRRLARRQTAGADTARRILQILRGGCVIPTVSSGDNGGQTACLFAR